MEVIVCAPEDFPRELQQAQQNLRESTQGWDYKCSLKLVHTAVLSFNKVAHYCEIVKGDYKW